MQMVHGSHASGPMLPAAQQTNDACGMSIQIVLVCLSGVPQGTPRLQGRSL